MGRGLAVMVLSVGTALPAPAQDPAALAGSWASAILELNEQHAKKPGGAKEADLGKLVPAGARAALDRLLKLKDAKGLAEALLTAGEAALDLDLAEDFAKIRKRLLDESPDAAGRLGVAVSRARFVARGMDGLDETWLAGFADVADAVLDAYGQVFAIKEWSKVPGKKLRFRTHLVEKITRPPHFAPQYPFHSEVDFPVADKKAFTSPTPDGKFLFYGLCHELGHVIAMWGDRDHEEDHHTWAHYTGVAIVEHLAKHPDPRVPEKDFRDVKWRSLEKEREEIGKTKPSLADKNGVMALWIGLHDLVGPAAIGAAINALDRAEKRLRINRVRYYEFKELKAALLGAVKAPATRKSLEALWP